MRKCPMKVARVLAEEINRNGECPQSLGRIADDHWPKCKTCLESDIEVDAVPCWLSWAEERAQAGAPEPGTKA